MSYRIASAQSRDSSLIALQRHEKSLSEARERLISGRRVDKPSDDPAAAARAERARVNQTRSEGLLRSMEASRTAMSLAESTMGGAIELLQGARETIVCAGNGIYNAADRTSLAESLKHVRGELLRLANTTDTGDHYIFGGQAALRANSTLPSSSTMAASTGVGLFQCVQPQAGQRRRSLSPPSSAKTMGASAVAQWGQKRVS